MFHSTVKIDRAAVMRHAWRLAKEIGVSRSGFGTMLRFAWAEARREAREAAYSQDRKDAIREAEMALACAQAIDCTAVAMPQIFAAEARLRELRV